MISYVVQLLHKLSIRGVNGPEKLLKVIKVRFSCLVHVCEAPWTQRCTYRIP